MATSTFTSTLHLLSNTTIKSSIFEQYFDGFVKNTLNALGSVVINIKSFIAQKNFVEKVMTPLEVLQMSMYQLRMSSL